MSTTLTTVEEEVIDLDNNINDEFQVDDQAAKEALNDLLESIPFIDEQYWNYIFSQYNNNSLVEMKPEKGYKVACVDLLLKLAQKHNWQLAKDGDTFYIYNGEYWIKVENDIMKFFLNTATERIGIPKWIGTDEKFVTSLYSQLQLKGFFEKMIQRETTYLNLKNGTLKIGVDGVNLEEFRPSHFLTHQLDFEYDPSSVNDMWLDFINTVIPDINTQKTLQQALAYLFVRDLKLEKAVFLYGTGSNGKSVIFEVLRGLISSDMMTNYSLESLTNSYGYQRAGINNKLINYGSDISMKKVDAATFKQLVSGEPIGVRQIQQKPYTMRNYAKLIFNLNKLEDADLESTYGFFRRMVFIPFEKTIAKEDQDKTLHKKILKNKSGVLNWIIEGIEEIVKNEEIFISDKSENFLEKLRHDSNPILLFIEDSKLIQTDGKSGEVLALQELYNTYRGFCKKQGEKPPKQREFNAELERLGFHKKRRNTGNVWFAKFDFIPIV